MTPDRYSHSRAILGASLFDKVQSANILIVGAGGIGCELIKNLVMTGFATSPSGGKGKLTVLDLDTIDLSNLNRQFLFQKHHVKRPKAVVAKETALKFNPEVNIEALHRNIKDADFPPTYFSQFDLVLNALDNLDARRHVNRMCLAAGVPLVESGTSGYVGQVQPIFQEGEGGEEVECFDCMGKPVPKTFAVCTIRSTPTTAHHCIAWAKSYLLPQLFGADDEGQEEEELKGAEAGGENASEIANLRAETALVRQLRATLSVDAEGAPKRVFEKVYQNDINRLLKMEDMWVHRRPPVPLSWETLENAASSSGTAAAEVTAAAGNGNGTEQAKLKDQRKLEVRDSWALFCDAVHRLCVRVAAAPTEPINFDKDDDDTLDFVVGAANLRAEAFGIESQTKWQVKEYAGNIIPAIATTNAIIAASLVQQSLHLLRSTLPSSSSSSSSSSPSASLLQTARNIWLKRNPTRIFDVSPLAPPNPLCPVCRTIYAPLSFVPSLTLGEFVDSLIGTGKAVDFKAGEGAMVSITEGSRLVYETEEFEDNKGREMGELGLGEGKFVTVEVEEDEDERGRWPVVFCVGAYLPSTSTDRIVLSPKASGRPSIPTPIPTRAALPPPPSEDLTTTSSSSKPAEDDDLEIVFETEPAAQMAVHPLVGAEGNDAAVVGGARKRSAGEAGLEDEVESGGKKQKAEEQGGEVVIDLTDD